MKLDPHLPQLPSIAELLEHPRVKGAVARINRSTLAHRAAGFVEELRSSLAKRTGLTEVPSVTQLAERLARKLLGEPPRSGPVINATGVVVGDAELTPPLADSAVHALMHVASEYHAGKASLDQLHAVERQLSRLAGAEAALMTSSAEAAVTLVLAATAGNREAVVVEAPPAGSSGWDWHWLAARAGAVLRGSASDAKAALEAAKGSTKVGAIVRAVAAAAEADGLRLGELSPAASERAACLVDVAPLAGLFDPADYGLPSSPTIKQRLTDGADVVVVDGAGLLGGPSCGLVLGVRHFVEAASHHPLASLLAPLPTSVAALAATLAIYEEDNRDAVNFAIPAWHLLSTPIANLQQRAERLAALIAASKTVAGADALKVESAWLHSGAGTATSPSWVIAVRPQNGDAAALVERLQRGGHPIVVRHADDAVHLDLRSVFPRWDQSLAGAFEEGERG